MSDEATNDEAAIAPADRAYLVEEIRTHRAGVRSMLMDVIDELDVLFEHNVLARRDEKLTQAMRHINAAFTILTTLDDESP